MHTDAVTIHRLLMGSPRSCAITETEYAPSTDTSAHTTHATARGRRNRGGGGLTGTATPAERRNSDVWLIGTIVLLPAFARGGARVGTHAAAPGGGQAKALAPARSSPTKPPGDVRCSS